MPFVMPPASPPPPEPAPIRLADLPADLQDRIHAIGRQARKLIRLRSFQPLFEAHLGTFEALLAAQATYADIGGLLAQVGVVRSNGTDLPEGTISSGVSRARGGAAARQVRPPEPEGRPGAALQDAAGPGGVLQVTARPGPVLHVPAHPGTARQAPAGHGCEMPRPRAAALPLTEDASEPANEEAAIGREPDIALPADTTGPASPTASTQSPAGSAADDAAARNAQAGKVLAQLRRRSNADL